MSKPRPFHHPPRELRTAPDESEPAFSYEDESEDFEFHQRYARGPRRDSGGNSGSGHFWRTTSGTGEPPFSSVKIQSPDKVEKGSSALAAVMQSDGVSVESAGSGSPSAPATISSNQTVRWVSRYTASITSDLISVTEAERSDSQSSLGRQTRTVQHSFYRFARQPEEEGQAALGGSSTQVRRTVLRDRRWSYH